MACGPDFLDISLANMAASIKELGAQSCVMVTDFGQAHDMPLVKALGQVIDDMLSNGISESEVERMLSINPKHLLNITS